MAQLSLLDRYHQLVEDHRQQFEPRLQQLEQQVRSEVASLQSAEASHDCDRGDYVYCRLCLFTAGADTSISSVSVRLDRWRLSAKNKTVPVDTLLG
jgi:hypothetical protein